MTAKEILDKYYPYPNDFHEDCDVYKAMQEYARIKCFEAIKKTRYKVTEVLNNIWVSYNGQLIEVSDFNDIVRDIQNIRNQDAMPTL